MLKTKIAGIELRNCFMNASGVYSTEFGYLKEVADAGAGALVTKTLTLEERNGNREPRLHDIGDGFVQAMGLPNPGYKNFDFNTLKSLNLPVIASFAGKNIMEFVEIADYLDKKADMLEVNISCPNVEGLLYAYNKKEISDLLPAIREATEKPLTIKIPYYPVFNWLNYVIEVAVQNKYQCITAINSLPCALVIDRDIRKFVVTKKYSALSGSHIKELGLGSVRFIYENFKDEIDIIGVGGIMFKNDAIDYILAGAKAVAIGSALLRYKPESTFKNIKEDLEDYMIKHNFKDIEDFRGKLEEI